MRRARFVFLGDFGDHLPGCFAQRVQHARRQAAQLDAVLLQQGLQRPAVVGGEIRQGVRVDRLGGHFDHGAQVFRQGVEGRLVDDGLQCRPRLVPAGIVVVAGRGVQPQGQVVVGADPFHGVDHPGLQRREDFAAGHRDRHAPDPPQHFAAQPRDAHLQALQVIQRTDFLVEPAGHLRAGIAGRQGHQGEGLVQLPPEFQAAAVV